MDIETKILVDIERTLSLLPMDKNFNRIQNVAISILDNLQSNGLDSLSGVKKKFNIILSSIISPIIQRRVFNIINEIDYALTLIEIDQCEANIA